MPARPVTLPHALAPPPRLARRSATAVQTAIGGADAW